MSELLRESLVRNPAGAQAPFAELVPAALLHCDLSGFTELAERLSGDQARGAETTHAILNRHFCRVLERIECWNGAVLKFAGDAAIALWTANTSDGLAGATALAVRCGLELQSLIESTVAEDGFVLRQRLVVGAGDVWLAHVGGVDDKWEFIVSGDPWRQIRLADALAPLGTVVLSSEAWSLIEHGSDGVAIGGGCHAVTSCTAAAVDRSSPNTAETSISAEWLARYVSKTTRRQVQEGHHEWLAEFRRVTVLFLRMDGLDSGASDSLARLHAAAQAIQHLLNEHDGNILQFLVDDKGLVLLAAWGLALSSHDDDAERALMAGRALASALRGLGFAVSAGVKSGRVFAGLLGNERHFEYAIIGDPVNAASRLMAASNGELLCDRATSHAAHRRFTFELAGLVQVKGKSMPLETYRVTSARIHRQGAPREMVGRAAERALVERLVDAASVGKATRLVHIVGEPGIGKSNLVQFLQSRARERGLRCLVTAGDSLRGAEAYFAWKSIFPQMLGTDANDVDALSAAVAELPRHQELLPLLNPLLSRPVPATTQTDALDGAGRADLTRDFLADIAAATQSKSPQLIVLDDAHWFDSATWQLIVTLQRKVPELPIVLLSRPFDSSQLPAEVQRMLESPGIERIELGPLSFEENHALIALRLGVNSVSQDLTRRIFQRAEGNPLFTEELLLALEQQHAIRRMEHGAVLARDSERVLFHDFPESVEGAVASRIDGLDPARQLSIKVASVLGRRFSLQALAAIRPVALPEAELRIQLEQMCAADVLEHDPSGEFRFRHAIIHEVVHGLLVSEQQRQLHRVAAELYEREQTNGSLRQPALLAHHWALAEDDDKAIEYLERAAEQAHSDHAKLEVASFMREAMERAERRPHTTSPARQARWNQLLGEAEMDLGLYTQAEVHLGRAISALDRPQPRGGLGLGFALAREAAAHALLRAGGPRRRTGDRGHALAAARCYSALASIYYNNHELGRMLLATVAGANLAMRVGEDSPVLARMLANLSIVAISVPGVDPDYYSGAALQMAERLGEPGALHEVLLVVGVYEAGAGHFARATEHFERAIDISRSIGEVHYWATALGCLANVYRLRGEFERADRLDTEVLQSGFDRNVELIQVWGFFGRACTLTTLNRHDELEELLRSFGKLLEDDEVLRQVSISNVVAHLLAKALLELHRGRDAPSFAAVARSIELIDSVTHLQSYMTCTIGYLQDALMACWRRRPDDLQVHRMCEKGDRFVERCAGMFPSAKARALLGQGNRALRRGNARKAAHAFRGAVAEAERIDNPFDRACALDSLSRCDALETEEREQHRSACRRELAHLGIAEPFTWSV